MICIHLAMAAKCPPLARSLSLSQYACRSSNIHKITTTILAQDHDENSWIYFIWIEAANAISSSQSSCWCYTLTEFLPKMNIYYGEWCVLSGLTICWEIGYFIYENDRVAHDGFFLIASIIFQMGFNFLSHTIYRLYQKWKAVCACARPVDERTNIKAPKLVCSSCFFFYSLSLYLCRCVENKKWATFGWHENWNWLNGGTFMA